MPHVAPVDHYGAQYGQFAIELYAQIRRDTFGEDIGQNGRLTAEEQDLFLSWLDLRPENRLLDVACGSGGPTLRVARRTGCSVVGIDVHEQAVREARVRATTDGLAARASFERVDGAGGLPFANGSFDAVTCIDAVNHLPERTRVFAEWARVLRPGGRLVFTDPIVVTGPLTNEEIAIRSSIGFFLFVPAGVDERLLGEAGFDVLHVEETVRRTWPGWPRAGSRRARRGPRTCGASRVTPRSTGSSVSSRSRGAGGR